MINFPGFSGKFIFDQRSKQPLLQEYADIKISVIYETPSSYTNIKGWVITDSKGFKFYFGQYNNSSIFANKDDITNSYVYTPNSGISDQGAPPLSSQYNSWQLVAVESPYGNKVEFKYELETTQFYRRSYDKINFNGNTKVLTSNFSKSSSKEFKIKEIIFDQGKIQFIKSQTEREDLTGGKTLNQIVVSSNNQTIAKYNLHYSYSTDNNTGNINPFLKDWALKGKKRLFLDSIKKEVTTSSGSLYEPYYSFEYINKNLVPNRFSNSQDMWGYYNGKSNGPFLTFFKYDTQVIDRTVDTIKSQTGLLNKIILPTGGNKEFVYEANKATPPDYFEDILYGAVNPKESKQAGMIKDISYNVGNGLYEVPFEVKNEIFGYISTVVQFMGNYGTCSSTQPLSSCNYQASVKGVDNSYYSQIYMGNNVLVALSPGKYKIEVKRTNGSDDPSDFENSFAVSLSWEELIKPEVIYSGGNRIQKTKLNSIDNGVLEKTYTYLTPTGKSSGLVYSLPTYFAIQKVVNNVPVIDQYGARPGSPLLYEQ